MPPRTRPTAATARRPRLAWRGPARGARRMPERFCEVGRGIPLCYETFGEESAPPLLLIQGLGMQMVGWPEEFCERLAAGGFYVVRFDNRDTGRSTHLPG